MRFLCRIGWHNWVFDEESKVQEVKMLWGDQHYDTINYLYYFGKCRCCGAHTARKRKI